MNYDFFIDWFFTFPIYDIMKSRNKRHTAYNKTSKSKNFIKTNSNDTNKYHDYSHPKTNNGHCGMMMFMIWVEKPNMERHSFSPTFQL